MVMSGETTGISQEANTVILEMTSASKYDIKDLRRSEGKVLNRISKTIQSLKESGQVSDNVQPIIVIFKQKKDGGLLG